MGRAGIVLVLLLAGGAAQAADRVVLRMAAIAPEGTAWAREVHAMSRELSAATGDRLGMKWYMGGIAGDELTSLDRVRRGQLDGLAGVFFCSHLAPSLKVTRILDLVHGHDEAIYVLGRLRGLLNEEMRQNGFELLALGNFGHEVLVTREPVRSLADLRRTRIWIWSLDELWKRQWAAVGVPVVPLPIEEARRAFEERRHDGYIAVPMGHLAYQWSAGGRYFTELDTAFLHGCMVAKLERIQSLEPPDRQALQEVVAKFQQRFNDLTRAQDAALLGGLFAKQGLRRIELTAAARSELNAALARARDKVPDTLVPAALIQRVEGWLKEYREKLARP